MIVLDDGCINLEIQSHLGYFSFLENYFIFAYFTYTQTPNPNKGGCHMLFIIFIYIYACFNHVLITDVSTFISFISSIDGSFFFIGIVAITIFYIVCYFRKDRVSEEDMENKTHASLAIYVVMGLVVHSITLGISSQLNNTIMWVFFAVWPILVLAVTLVKGLSKKLSLKECFFRFFKLEAHMTKCTVQLGCFLLILSVAIVFPPAAMYADYSMGGDYKF